MPVPLDLPAWQQLRDHAQDTAEEHLRDWFKADPDRFQRFSRRFEGLLLDFSKNRIQTQTLDLLLELAQQAQVPENIEAMFRGDPINTSEQRPVLHTALRNRTGPALRPASAPASATVDDAPDSASDSASEDERGTDVLVEVNRVLDQIRLFASKVRNQTWQGYTGKPIRTIVNIGIGGSDLGPRLVCQALKPFGDPTLTVHFMSSVDGAHIHPILTACDPETTLFIVASKSFTTPETMANANTARDWLLAALGSDTAVARHFVAVSANQRAVEAFGIESSHMFEFWDWVVGRYSVWSAIGLVIAIYIGFDRFVDLLEGAQAMDDHFRTAPLAENLPVLLALTGIWNSNFQGVESHAVLVYDDYLRALPSYIQQLDMESNGKAISRDGQPVSWATGPVVWGGLGNNAQHAYFQLLHQGMRRFSADFIAPVETPDPLGQHHDLLLANCLAQSAALMQGRTEQEARAELAAQGLSEDEQDALVPYLVFAGNHPSNTILYRELTPRTLGSLLALFEHKVFVQGLIWNINSFDQWGAEAGKQLAKTLLPEVQGRKPVGAYDASTRGLLAYCRER